MEWYDIINTEDHKTFYNYHKKEFNKFSNNQTREIIIDFKSYMQVLNNPELPIKSLNLILISYISRVIDRNEYSVFYFKRILRSKSVMKLIKSEIFKNIRYSYIGNTEEDGYMLFSALIIYLIMGLNTSKNKKNSIDFTITLILEKLENFKLNILYYDYIINSLAFIYIAKNAHMLSNDDIIKIIRKLNINILFDNINNNLQNKYQSIIYMLIMVLAAQENKLYVAIFLLNILNSNTLFIMLEDTPNKILDKEDENNKSLRQHIKYRLTLLRKLNYI